MTNKISWFSVTVTEWKAIFTSLAVTAALIAFTAPSNAQATIDPALTLGPGDPLTISFVGGGTPQLRQNSMVAKPYADKIIPERSGGRVKVNFSTWSEMNLHGAEIIRLTRAAQVDISDSALTVVSGDVPILDLPDLPGLNPTIEDARKVSAAVLPKLNESLEKLGVRIIATYGNPAQVFWCNKPVTKLDDLRGLRIRSFGPALSDLLNAIGAQAISLSFGEVYSSLERGVIDCAISGTGSGNAARWYEVSTHMYTLSVGWSTMAYYTNLKWWNGLKPDVRNFLVANIAEMENKLWELAAAQTADGIACSTNRPGCSIGTPDTASPMVEVKASPEDVARIRTILERTVVPGWVKRCGTQCGEVFTQIVTPITGVKYTDARAQ